MTTWPQTDDVICLTSLSIHHCAGVDMSDSPTLAFLAGAGLHICHIFLQAYFYYTRDELRLLLALRIHGHLKGKETERKPID